MLFAHWVRLAAAREACTAGNNRATSTPMMAITTNSSTNVKPCRGLVKALRVRMTQFTNHKGTSPPSGAHGAAHNPVKELHRQLQRG
jgi:hypothetical protein